MPVTENKARNPAQQLVDALTADYKAGNLPLPSLPDVALRVRQAVEDDDKGVVDVARIIQLDAALAARVIQSANSARFGGATPVDSCQAAVSRLGMKAVRDVVMALVMKGMFRTHSLDLAVRMKDTWRHSVRVAAISHVIGSLATNLDSERSMLAGLVHDIGVLPLLYYAERFPQVTARPGMLDHLIRKLRPQLGGMVLRHWGFDADLVHVPLEVDKLTRNPSAKPDYADVVLIANIFSTFGTKEKYDGPPVDELPAFCKLPLGALGPEGGVEVLEEAREQINAVMAMLRG